MNYSNQLNKIKEIQNTIKNIHPLLKKLYPIAIVKDNKFHVYDFNVHQNEYSFVLSSPVPFNVPEKIRAAFDLQCYENKPSCVITLDIFDDVTCYCTIFHEFVHCYQAENCELKLKKPMIIFKQAMKSKDYMWEINYPFPYEDLKFKKLYIQFLALSLNVSLDKILMLRKDIKEYLDKRDYQYLIWQEWKEGFARFIENKINIKLNFKEIKTDNNTEISRVTFYAGGEKFIKYLSKKDNEIINDLQLLFKNMML